MPTITDRQNELLFLRPLAAARRFYDQAQWWDRLRLGGAVVFVTVGVLVTFWYHDAGAYVAAVAGAWVLLGRTICDHTERAAFLRGARAQERADTNLFEIPWNRGVAGVPLAEEDIVDAARGFDLTDRSNWYPRAADESEWPINVLICQRASAAWGRRAHAAYATRVMIAAGGWVIVTLIIGVAAHLTVGSYLLWLFLPSQPALLDGIDIGLAHREIARRKGEIEDLVECALQSGDVSVESCRAIQDRLFETRRLPPRVPNWYYEWRRTRDEDAMQQAAASLATRSI